MQFDRPHIKKFLRPSFLRTAQGVLRAKRVLVTEWPAAVSGWRARARDPGAIVRVWPPAPPTLPPDVAVFVHYDQEGRLRQSVRAYLAALRTCGFGVVFVSNSGELDRLDEVDLRLLCDGYIVRRNVGYDFGAMREALAYFQLPRVNTRCVLLLNDSIEGPFASLSQVLSRVDLATADLWGATDSPQRGRHLQSYFLAASRTTLTHPAWAAFWADVRPAQSKEWVIKHYEIGLSQTLTKAGLRCKALFPYEALVAQLRAEKAKTKLHSLQRERSLDVLARNGLLNPTAHLWRQLIRSGFPFIKRELLGRNPARIIDVSEWHLEVDREGLEREQ